MKSVRQGNLCVSSNLTGAANLTNDGTLKVPIMKKSEFDMV